MIHLSTAFFSRPYYCVQEIKISLTVSRLLDTMGIASRASLSMQLGPFSPYYVQEISLTMSSLLDTMGIACRSGVRAFGPIKRRSFDEGKGL